MKKCIEKFFKHLFKIILASFLGITSLILFICLIVFLFNISPQNKAKEMCDLYKTGNTFNLSNETKKPVMNSENNFTKFIYLYPMIYVKSAKCEIIVDNKSNIISSVEVRVDE